MIRDFLKSCAHVCVCAGALLPGMSGADNHAFEQRVTQSVLEHPSIQAAQAELEASLAQVKVFGSALYNPELGAELESEGSDTNFRVGVSQKLDWWNRQEALSAQAENANATAHSQYQSQLTEHFAEALRVLAEIDAAKRELEFARSQEDQQRQILALVEQRQQAGDLGQVDAELAYLGLIEKITESTQASAALTRTEAQLGKVLPGFTRPFDIPETLWNTIDQLATSGKQAGELASEHPEAQQAMAEWQSKKSAVRLARLEAKAEPELGFGAGRSGDNNVFALSLSMPLHIRNDFSSNIEAANQALTSAQVAYQAATQNRIAEIEASHSILRQYRESYAQWQEMISGRKSSNEELLERLWGAGELGTTEYLNIRQQSSAAIAAGIELKTALDQARIDWLVQSGQIQTLFMPGSEQ
jgi:cobalt-zinc-cadmium efflux system outer membrane protein